jgi:hypothetical protein
MTVYDMRLQLGRLAARAAYVGLGVTAIASLRGELFGRQVG